jgi:hypothetical protein
MSPDTSPYSNGCIEFCHTAHTTHAAEAQKKGPNQLTQSASTRNTPEPPPPPVYDTPPHQQRNTYTAPSSHPWHPSQIRQSFAACCCCMCATMQDQKLNVHLTTPMTVQRPNPR